MSDTGFPGAANPAVVDTDVVSFWRRNDTRGDPYLQAVAGHTLVISFQTVAELLRWAEQHDWGDRRRADLERYLQQFIVYPYTFSLAREWARIMTEASKAGIPMKAGDAWIAATARLAGVPLITHNRKDFQAVRGLQVISFAP